MVSDFVKGKKKYDYPADIRQGIALHRAIDEFTDTHAATREAKEVFRPAYRLYSGAFVDVVYDHFLASDEGEFPNDTLAAFAQQVYTTLDGLIDLLPPGFQQLFPYMKTHNWLLHYGTGRGMANSMKGVAHRARYLSEGDTAYLLFEQHYQLLQQCYRQFWKDMKPYARQQYEWLIAGHG